jgi:hypothetical protein
MTVARAEKMFEICFVNRKCHSAQRCGGKEDMRMAKIGAEFDGEVRFQG